MSYKVSPENPVIVDEVSLTKEEISYYNKNCSKSLPIEKGIKKFNLRSYTKEDVIKIYEILKDEVGWFGEPVFNTKKHICLDHKSKVKKYEFDIIDYDNSDCSDKSSYHNIFLTKISQQQRFQDIFKKNFEKVTFKDSGYSISVQINKPEHELSKKGIWYTLKDRDTKYPIVILSFNRANDKDGLTHILLSKMKINHKLFIEPQHEKQYRKWYDETYCELIVCPRNFSEDDMGSCRVRTYICEYFKEITDRVWMLDDNIRKYIRYHLGKKKEIIGSGIFTSVEDYIDRYDNVGLVSHNLNGLTRCDVRVCIVKNGKQFSSILCPTDTIWSHKYEEDLLLSIEYVEKGLCNLCFNHIQYDKLTSGTNNGGNQDKVYNDGGYSRKIDYLHETCEKMFKNGDLSLKEGYTNKTFCKEISTKSQPRHHKMSFPQMINHSINDIVKKSDYEKIVSTQKKIDSVYISK